MNWRKIAIDASIILGANLIIYFAVKRILSNTSQETRQASEKALKMLKRTRNQKLKLTEHEIIIAAQVIDPEDIPVNFSDIAGLDLVVESLLENVIYPLRYPKMYSGISDLLSAPKGVLLYGPPGTSY